MMQNFIRQRQRQRRSQKYPQATPAESINRNPTQHEPVNRKEQGIQECNRRLSKFAQDENRKACKRNQRCFDYMSAQADFLWHLTLHRVRWIMIGMMIHEAGSRLRRV